ncbi:hypothetical protein NAEGRDRAFT_63246 [Naegleria gruberi]|uniref:Uncharacterized protein n=1 Tax=Naegleria gruberi TaxID=5762 RepID=D2V367_NAEGR|nr:uncharacterized protein NAEGRDRAFT_63246 [Naegleria gruberi]EFC48723.1 hypothetical protein NAEGRDRAFT_63246 [Naegleria gruberi]|eukprot:XP_002681467.1 hypothetical protein NAEGRDRAFT_63246 [Naegleria gruberi strain NEG-M]
MHTKHSLYFACILILLLSFVITFSKATSSSCRSPSDTSSSSSKRTTTLSAAHVEELLESELLSAHLTLSTEEELDEEDLEYFHEVTSEQVNTLRFGRRFRRAFRRLRRVVRRIGRAVGRVVKAAVKLVKKLTGVFRRRKAAQIIANSVQTFNGYTGPTKSKLESRRQFDGSSLSTVTGATQTLKSASKVAKSTKRKSKKAKKSILKKFGKRLGKRLANRLVSSMNKLLKKTKKTSTSSTSSSTSSKCVACRVDCMKEYSGIGALYTGCTSQYYYYGCQLVAPCLKTSTADDDEIEGMVGICAYRNGCKFKSEWRSVGTVDSVTNKLLKKIRASAVDPE